MPPANDNTPTPTGLRAYLQARLRLIPNWRETLKHAWSVRVDVLLILLSGLEFGIDAIAGSPPIDPMKFAALAFAVKVTGLGLRLVYQPKVSGGAA